MAEINEEEYNKIVSNLDVELLEILENDSTEHEDFDYLDIIRFVNLQDSIDEIEADFSQFELFFESSHQKFMDEKVLEIGVFNVLVVDDGRNAWFSQWSRKFNSLNAFFLDLDSAKKYAEDNRKQGSVFTIVPTPSIYFKLNHSYIFFHDLAAHSPFNNWNAESLKLSRKISNFGDFYDLFRLNSYNWNLPIPKDEKFYVSIVFESESIEKIEVKNLDGMRSVSVGKDYYLNWNVSPAEYDNKSILKAIKILNKVLSKKSTRKGTPPNS